MDFNIFFGFQNSGSQCYKSCLLGSILSWEGEIALNLQKKSASSGSPKVCYAVCYSLFAPGSV